jgi:hypothetical protein
MKLDESAQALIEITRQQGNRPMSEITVEAARAQSNALRSRLQPEAPELDQVRDGVIAGDGPEIPFRLYKKLSSTEAEPVMEAVSSWEISTATMLSAVCCAKGRAAQ